MVPGLIDTHIHAPQYPNIGIGYDKTLLDWLQQYTYPLETKFSDLNFAERVYNTVVVSIKIVGNKYRYRISNFNKQFLLKNCHFFKAK